jgi:Tol biopolymer transport system component
VARIKLDRRGTNAGADVYVHHLKTHRTERVSVTRSGKPPNHGSFDPSLSDNGRFVAFTSFASNLVRGDSTGTSDVFIRDLKRRVTKRIGGKHRSSLEETFAPALSGNGRFVVFFSSANEFYDDTDDNRFGAFRRDLKTGATQRVDVKSSGGPARGGGSFDPAISDDGEIVVFSTGANNLVPDDTNIKGDVFVRDIPNHTTTRASVDSAGRQVKRNSRAPVISGDGRFAAFQSNARNLVSGDTNIKTDVFVRGPLRP